MSRAASSSASNSGSNAPHESPLTSSISAEVSNCPVVKEIALPPTPPFLPVARSVSSLSDATPCLQSTCRNRGLIGESGRDAATKFPFFNSVRSLKTVPVPKLRLELDREDDSLLFVRVLLSKCSRCCATLMTSSGQLRSISWMSGSLNWCEDLSAQNQSRRNHLLLLLLFMRALLEERAREGTITDC